MFDSAGDALRAEIARLRAELAEYRRMNDKAYERMERSEARLAAVIAECNDVKWDRCCGLQRQLTKVLRAAATGEL